MTAQILDGKLCSDKLKIQLKNEIDALKHQFKIAPGLAVVLVGEDPASQIYVKRKIEACEQLGIESFHHYLSHDVSQETVLALIQQLNHDPKVNGILVQLPLPPHLDSNLILDSILPAKDVDGFHPENIGLLAQKRPRIRSCTPYGIVRLLDFFKINVTGLNATIVGASNIVGRPMGLELLLAGATVTICHSRTRDLADHVNRAEVLVAALGKPKFIATEWIRPDAVVIDVGIHRLEDGSLCGDVDFHTAKEVASWITPVPGGVGPMTVATLMANTVFAFQFQHNAR